MSLYQSIENHGIWAVIFSNLELISCLQDCQITQVGYQGQTRYTRILDCKPFIYTYYSIGHGLEMKLFLFTQFLHNTYREAHLPWVKKWELETWKLGLIFEIELWMVGQEHSRCSDYFELQIAWKIFQLKIKARSVNAGLHIGFKHHISFATNLATNLGYQSIQNHARDFV